jgi:hypothetical protein
VIDITDRSNGGSPSLIHAATASPSAMLAHLRLQQDGELRLHVFRRAPKALKRRMIASPAPFVPPVTKTRLPANSDGST